MVTAGGVLEALQTLAKLLLKASSQRLLLTTGDGALEHDDRALCTLLVYDPVREKKSVLAAD